MPTITGRLQPTDKVSPRQHPPELPVTATDTETGEIVASGRLGPYDDFTIDVPSTTPRKLKIEVALPGVAPALLDFDGVDAELFLYFENTHTSRF